MLATLTLLVGVQEFTISINTSMNYNKIYESLVSHRKQHPATGYTEKHHIIMRSMGGDDSNANLVRLTGREHWIAHLLLHKIHRNSQTAFACNMMAMRCEERGIPFVKNSRMYEHIRKLSTKFIGDKNKITHIGEGNSQYGTRWICNLNTRKNRKISKELQIPEDWIEGRNKWKIEDRKKALKHKRATKQLECYKKWENYFYLWQQSHQPIDKFIKELGYNGTSTATQMWSKLNLYKPKQQSALV